MKKSQRWTEKWFTLGLWLVAFIFATFLIQLGGIIVADLPKVETRQSVEDFIDPTTSEALEKQRKEIQAVLSKAEDAATLAQDKAERASLVYKSTKEQFSNWMETRRTTNRQSQDNELIERTKRLNELQQEQLQAQQEFQAARQNFIQTQSTYEKIYSQTGEQLSEIRDAAYAQFSTALQWTELKVFLYRLALTLPLLVIAGWLFVKKRKNAYWPFVWGFTFFALFAFFVELVPYLPSYGGYVRSSAGVILSVFIGVSAIRAFKRYIERQKQAEQQPEKERRREIEYDKAMAQLSKSICPGCDRHVELSNEKADFCPHCGLSLFDHCEHCNTRKSSFSLFCFACGDAALAEGPLKDAG